MPQESEALGSEDTRRMGDRLPPPPQASSAPPTARPGTQRMVGVSTLFYSPKSRDVPSFEETVRALAPSSCGGQSDQLTELPGM